MSIPKEPRQLMINVMYLVLTALLALNVSAEIFNAFAMVDKGLRSANSALDASNAALPEQIKTGAKKKASLQTYADRVDGVGTISKETSAYIQGLVDKLIDEGGDKNGKNDAGDYIEAAGLKEPKGKRDYDATTRLMVDSGEGMKLKAKMEDTRKKFLALIDPADQPSFKLPLEIDDTTWK
jgi:hypothetical protein